MVTVRVDSDDVGVCGLVSVQPRECPFADAVGLVHVTASNKNIYPIHFSTLSCQPYEARYKGRWQTLLGTAVIDIRQADRFKSGFYIVVMIEEDGDRCVSDTAKLEGNTTDVNTPSRYGKSVRIMIEQKNLDVMEAVITVLVFYFFTCVLGYVLVMFQMPVDGKVIIR